MSVTHSLRPPACWDFLHDQVLTASITAAFARARIYRPGASEEEGKLVRGSLRSHLLALEPRYRVGSVNDEDHLARIEELADSVSKECAEVLAGRRLRIGVAQKALNLFLKYLWCLGRIPEPPHCPFDGIVIGALELQRRVAWTSMDSRDEYLALVKAAREIADRKGQSLARWELGLWNMLALGARESGVNDCR